MSEITSSSIGHILTPYFQDTVLFPVGVRVTPGLVQVIIDADTGVTLDDCAKTTRHITLKLAEAGIDPGEYKFEVSSPGAERPLSTQREWRKNVGRFVSLTTLAGKVMEGKLLAAFPSGLAIALDAVKGRIGKPQLVPWEDIVSGNVVIR